MYIKKCMVAFLFLVNFSFTIKCQTLNLQECYQKAAQNLPLSKNSTIQQSTFELNLQNIQSLWYPGIEANAQATYQSDVVSLDIDFPLGNIDIPSASKDQYKASLDISQMLYDGGIVKAQKMLANAELELGLQNIEVKKYKTREQVNKAFFGILFLQEKKALIRSLVNELNTRLKTVLSAVENGVVLASEGQVLQAEIIKAKQQQTETDIALDATIKMLELLIGEGLAENYQLEKPEIYLPDSIPFERPEQHLMDKEKEKLDALSKIAEAKRMPKLMAFGQFGYGKPGLNMLRDEWDTYYIVGAKLNWKVYDWNTTKREKQLYALGAKSIDNEEENLLKNLEMALIHTQGNINALEKLIVQDKEICKLRASVTKTYSARLEQGVVTSSDYIAALNEETRAKLNTEMHLLQLLQEKVNCLTILGRD